MNFKNHPERKFAHVICTPFVWYMLIFFVLFDLALEIYHQICFRLFRIPLVKRDNYIKIDRHKLNYLSKADKARCVYCGYANGLLAYAVKITAETEKYWCAIRHEKDEKFVEPDHQQEFVEFGDEAEFVKRYENNNKNPMRV